MKKILLISAFLVVSLEIFAQSITVEGVITSADDGQTLPGATILEKGTNNGTVTDIYGYYKITVSPSATLQFSYVGMESQETQILGRSKIDISLRVSATDLDEVVVIGYGVQKKSLITGAISKLDAGDLEQNQVRIEQALQGKTAGVNIMQESGAPGGGLTVRIRGTSTNKNSNPLFVVDGMRTGGIEYLNPNDIASIEILKDAASAAIYGAEAANGVVLVTTKSGTKDKSTISYTGYYGMQEARNITEVLNAQQYATYFRDGLEHELRSKYPNRTDEQINTAIDAAYPFNPDTLGKGTDWMNEIFEPAPIQEHNISVTGGNEKTSVFFSGSYLTQDGIIGGSKANFERYTARLNAEHKAKEWLSVGGKLSFTHFERKSIDENNEFGGVISNAMNIDPLTPVYYSDTSQFPDIYKDQIYDNFEDIDNSSLSAQERGYYGMSEYVQNEIRNPRAQIDNNHNLYYQDKVLGGVNLSLMPIDGLVFKTAYDIDLAYGNNNWWTPRYYYHSVNYNFLSTVNQVVERWFTWQWENTLNYSKTFGLHDFNILAGNTLRDYSYYYFAGLGEGLQEESWNFAVFDAVLSDSTKSAVSGRRNEDNRLLSYFGRVNYNYDSRYMIAVTLRADASSKLSSANRTQYFPSVSLGWVLTNERFWNFSPINFLKFRFSWGQNGSIQSLSNFEYVSLITSGAEPSYYLSGGARLTGAEPTQLSNPDLIWETSEQTNVGIDLRLLKDRLTFTADYYKKVTKGLITTASVPLYVGNDKPNANSGDITNQGVELELSYRGQMSEFKYDIGLNAAYNKNEVTSLESPLLGANLGTTGAITRSDEGKPVWYFYGYKADGIFDSFDDINAYINDDGDPIQPSAIPGDVRLVDVDGNGKIDENDKTMIGNPHPDWTFGLNTNFSYKGFDLTIFLSGTLGNDVYYGAYRTDLDANNKPLYFYENAWTPENQTDDFPRYTVNSSQNFSHNSMFVFDGSHIRLQNLELGYSLSKPVLKRIHIEKLRVYVSGKNLFILSNYPGADPEVGNSTNWDSNKTSIGIDRGLYPRPRIISFGINLTI